MSGRTTSRHSSADVLNKKVPSNPKYKDVRSKLDTGASMSKYLEKVEEMRRNYRYRKDEIFKRMKVSTFVTLVIQVYNMRQVDSISEFDDDLGSVRSPSQGGDSNGSPVPSIPLTDREDNEVPDTARSTLQSVISGVGECNVNDREETLRTPLSSASSDVPYLLLDLRDADAFDKCHIISAKNYPVAMLSRAVNNYTKDILQYRNKPGRLIIIYDEDERIAIKAAETFVQRGFDNTFMLSGGLKVAAQKYPHSLITGTVPASCVPSPPSTKGKKGSPLPQQIIPASQQDFNEDDICRLQDQLDEALVPSDTGSRLSRASTRSQSNASVASSRASTSLSSTSSQPWR